MPGKTDNLKLNTWLESDVVDFADMNENFGIIDGLVSCVKSYKASSKCTGASSAVADWYCKEFSDGRVDALCKIKSSDIACSVGDTAPYSSGAVVVKLPAELYAISNVQMGIASDGICWVHDVTASQSTSSVSFKVIGMESEKSAKSRTVYISVKGVM